MQGKARLAGLKDELVEGFRLREAQKQADVGNLGLLGLGDTYKNPDLTLANKAGYLASNPAVQLAGLGLTGMTLGNMFFGNNQQAQAPQQSFVMNPVPASASQSMP
jgi:hypothetical protein